MNSQSIWQEQRQKMSPTAGTACDNRAPCPVIRASRTGSETFRGLTRVVHLLRAGMWLPDEAEVVHFPELLSGVCLVPALGHTTADYVVRFGSDSWQAIFLAYTHPCLLASSQPEGAERIAMTTAVPIEPMAARVEPPCCWWSGLPRNAGRHTTGVLSWWRRLPPYDPA
jgi:hypothetical protein